MMPIYSLPGILVLAFGTILIILSAIAVWMYRYMSRKTFIYIIVLLTLIIFFWYTTWHGWFKAVATFNSTFLFFLFLAGSKKHQIDDDCMTNDYLNEELKEKEKWDESLRC